MMMRHTVPVLKTASPLLYNPPNSRGECLHSESLGYRMLLLPTIQPALRKRARCNVPCVDVHKILVIAAVQNRRIMIY